MREPQNKKRKTQPAKECQAQWGLIVCAKRYGHRGTHEGHSGRSKARWTTPKIEVSYEPA